jgi:hypothetical protein
MKPPDFFLVGAPKAGTTALGQFLQGHPEIFMVPPRFEPTFFATDLLELGLEAVRSAKEYASLFEKADYAKRVGEKSVWYMYSKTAASAIKAFCPSAYIIMMLRNPVDMLHSYHAMLVNYGEETVEDFAKALEAEGDRKRGRGIPEGLRYPVSLLFYSDIARLSEQVGRYLKLFPKEKVRVIVHDDFREDNRRLFRETLEFLGVEPDFQPAFQLVNERRTVRSRLIRDLTRKTPLPVRRVWQTLVPLPIRTRLLLEVDRMNSLPVGSVRMDSDLRKRLQMTFSEDIEELGSLIGRDLRHWTVSD